MDLECKSDLIFKPVCQLATVFQLYKANTRILFYQLLININTLSYNTYAIIYILTNRLASVSVHRFSYQTKCARFHKRILLLLVSLYLNIENNKNINLG